jgi:hypothetical protein
MQYMTMARQFWGEVLSLKDVMKQPVLDSKRNRANHELLQSFLAAQKKFNVEIPEVRRFFEEYMRVSSRLDEMNVIDESAVKYLTKEVP